MKKVLIVDDSAYMRTMLNKTLTETGRYSVIGQAANGMQAVELALELTPDLITMDNILPDMLGVDVIKELRRESVPAKIIMISAVGQDAIVQESISSGANSYLVKPFSDESLIVNVDSLFADQQ